MDGVLSRCAPAVASDQDDGGKPGAVSGARSGAAVAEGAACAPTPSAWDATRCCEKAPGQGPVRVQQAAAPPTANPAAGPGAADAAKGAAGPGSSGRQLPSILCQTAAALGLWERLHDTASTPSTVLAPGEVQRRVRAANSLSTNQSAT